LYQHAGLKVFVVLWFNFCGFLWLFLGLQVAEVSASRLWIWKCL